jgi:hypothetical protein
VRFFLILVAVGAVYFVATHADVQFYSTSSAQPIAAAGDFQSGAVADVHAVVEASASTGADEAAGNATALLQHATDIGPTRGAELLRRRLPKLVAEIDAAMPLVRSRVAAVPVRTTTGVLCREAIVSLVAKQGSAIRSLGAEVATTQQTWRAVDRFAARAVKMSRWYAGQIVRCTQSAAPEDRAALRQAMRGF